MVKTCPKCGSHRLNSSNAFGHLYCESCGWISSPSYNLLSFGRGIVDLFKWSGTFLLLVFFFSLFVQFFSWKQFTFESSYWQIKKLFSSNDLESNLELGAICNTLKKFECSAEYFYLAVEDDPNHKLALGNLALALAHLGRWNEAKPNFEAYFSLGGGAQDIVFWYGQTLEHTGKASRGRDWYYYALKLNSQYKEVAEILTDQLVKEGNVDTALSLIGALNKGIINPTSEWRQFLDTREFLERPEEKIAQVNWVLPSFDSLNFYLPVILKKNARIHFFNVSDRQKENKINVKTIDEVFVTLPDEVRKEVKEKTEKSIASWDLTLENVQVGAVLFPTIDFVVCQECQNVLGEAFLQNFKTERWVQFKTEFLRIYKSEN